MELIGQANFVVSRPDRWYGKFSASSVLLDSAKIGKVKNGETVAFEVQPGSHYVQCRLGFLKSGPAQIQFHQGQTTRLIIELPTLCRSVLIAIGLTSALGATLSPYSLLIWLVGGIIIARLQGKPSIRVLEG